MSKGMQKNFTIPTALAKNWNKFQPKGSKESSANASGALFLYMLMPSTVRHVARQASHESDFDTGRRFFWEKLGQISKDAQLAKALLDAVQVREEDVAEKMGDKASKTG